MTKKTADLRHDRNSEVAGHLDGHAPARQGRGRFAKGALGVLVLAGAVAVPGLAGAATLHDTWGRSAPRYVTAAQAHPGDRASARGTRQVPAVSRIRRTAASGTGAVIRAQRNPVLGTEAAAVLGAINAIRARFGLSAARPTTVGASLVRAAAVAGADPNLLPVSNTIPEEYGIWGAVSGTTQATSSSIQTLMTAWVYQDGWMGSATENLDCTSPTAPGCNGHRQAILSTPPAPGDQLYANVAVVPSSLQGGSAVSVAAMLVWVAP